MRRPRATALPFAPVLFLFVLGSTSFGQAPGGPKGPYAPAVELERFRALDPAERLRMIDALPGVKTAFRAVERGDLTVAVVERGTLDAANAADLSCQVKARGKEGTPAATIKWVIEDGTIVKKGDRLVELDDAELRDEVTAARVRALAAAAVATAATEEMRRARRAGDLTVRLAEIEVELAEADLKEPPAGQARRVLELKVERAKLRLEQAKDEAKGRQVQAAADERARAAAAELEAGRARALEGELAKCVVTAPFDGIAVHHVREGSRFGPPPAVIAAGEAVREGQKMVRVVNLSRMVVGTRVHEARISSLRTGQPARVRVDAFPTGELTGKVSQVAAVAAQDEWARSDVKVYPVTVTLPETPLGLKPGMTAEVRIETGERKGVLLIPTRAVLGAGKALSCFVKEGEKVVEREVTTGATDGTKVEITAGLQTGDMVLADPSVVQPRLQPRKGGPGGPPG